ncbi:MAG: glycoside hydrolase family 16 protein [Pirellulales bacterium]
MNLKQLAARRGAIAVSLHPAQQIWAPGAADPGRSSLKECYMILTGYSSLERVWYIWVRVLFVLWYVLVGSSIIYAAPAGWNATWSDEFDGTQLDTSKWDPILWTTPFNNEQQAYHPSRATVSGGNLVLTADDANFGGKSFTSGKVESKFEQQHGRWEVRAKLPGTQGTWPAIWLLPDTAQYPWPSQGEIDILENRGNQPELTSSAFHWGPDFFGRQFVFAEQQATNGGQAENHHDDFHTYAVEWSASRLRFFVDDVHYYTISNANTGGFLGNQTAPMELNLNVAVGGDFLGGAQPNESSVWPQQMLVDYVRVYERDTAPPPVVFRNGNFEKQDGSLADWSTFGNTIPNVQSHSEAVLDGDSALKLFGQFSGGTNSSGVEQGISVSPGDSISASASAYVRSDDSISGTNNRVDLKFDYYSDFGGTYESSDYLSSTTITIANGITNNDQWLDHVLAEVVPAGAVEARLAVVFVQPDNQTGAVHIDAIQFVNLDLEFNADADNDGDVDGADFLYWQRGFGQNDGTSVVVGDFNFDGQVVGDDRDVWETQFGEGGLPLTSAATVPEPTSVLLMIFCCGGCITLSRSYQQN